MFSHMIETGVSGRLSSSFFEVYSIDLECLRSRQTWWFRFDMGWSCSWWWFQWSSWAVERCSTNSGATTKTHGVFSPKVFCRLRYFMKLFLFLGKSAVFLINSSKVIKIILDALWCWLEFPSLNQFLLVETCIIRWAPTIGKNGV